MLIGGFMDWAAIVSWLGNNWQIILEIVGAFAVIARFTPNTTDDKVIQHILDGINFAGMNHGKAKNV
jgi:hypothetical protein